MAHEESRTFEYNGRWVNIPSVEQSGENKGKSIPPDILKTHVGDKKRGLDNKSYSTVDEAVEAAKKRSRSFDVPSVPGPPQSLLDAQMRQQPQPQRRTPWYKQETSGIPGAPIAEFYAEQIDPALRDPWFPIEAATTIPSVVGAGAVLTKAAMKYGPKALRAVRAMRIPEAGAGAGALLADPAEAEGGKIKALYNLSETIWKNVVTKKPTILKPGKDALSKGFHERGHGARKGTEGLHEDLQRAAENAAKEGKGTVNDIVAATRLLAPKHTKLLQEDLLRKAARSSARPRWLPPHPSLREPR